MKRFLVRISFVLMLVILVPIIFFIFKQFSNLTENEGLVQEAYEKQLESVLFSININAENILNAWVNRIDIPVSFDSDILKTVAERVLAENNSLKQITFFSVDERKEVKTFSLSSTQQTTIPFPDLAKIKKLIDFQKNGYQRLEAQRMGETIEILFIPKATDDTMVCAFVLHAKTFIGQNLGASIQQVAQNRFSIKVVDDTNSGTVYTSGEADSDNQKFFNQKFLYFPDYSMNISLLSSTIDDLVKQRSQRDVYSLIALIVFVFLGSGFLIVNIRKEVKLAEMKAEFVSNVSHEIRTPLALISMYAETLLLKRVKNAEKAEEYLKVIHLETNRLSSMVNRILSFSKMEKNKRQYHFSFFSVNELVTEVADSFQPFFDEQKVDVKLSLSPDLEDIYADRDALAEAFINVMENGVKYGREEGKYLEIRTFQAEDDTIIEVEDNGIGISQKHIKHIFDKFYRVTQGDLAHKVKGTGLGLNIVKQIVKHHGGKVAVKSKLGEGSCFQLKISNKLK
jgi:two-component system phosphate regulon sensor histidine kinase PhoR